MMNNIFFQPFVGKDYWSGGIFGHRILVLGESHQCDEECSDCGLVSLHPECASYTSRVMGDYLNENKPREPWMHTYLKFERSLVGHETDWPERQQIWQSVLFFNFLQVTMLKPRQAGTKEQYQQAAKPFYDVIDEYRPEYIIAWGERLWGAMPGDERWTDGETISVDGYDVYTGSYRLTGGGSSRAMPVYHPSGGYSWKYWHKVIKEFLQR